MQRRTADDWGERVIAWHNRHPLARRIGAADLSAPGYVQLPFAGKRALFSERFIAGLSLRGIIRFGLRHGGKQPPTDDGLPRREIALDPRLARDDVIQPVWLATVAVGKRRVLLGTQALLGRRHWSLPRSAALALALLAAAAAPLIADSPLLRTAAVAPPAVAVVAALVDAALDVAADASEAAPDAAPEAAPDAAPGAAAFDTASDDVAAPDAPPDAAASAPAAVVAQPPAPAPAAPAAPFPPPRPALDESTKAAARIAGNRARAARAGVVYAIVGRTVRTEAESELLADALRGAVADAPPGWHVGVLPAGDSWRAVGWPIVQRDDAERLREQLAARGQQVEVVAF